MTRALAALAFSLLVGCDLPDTLHYQLRDPELVEVHVDDQPALGHPTLYVSRRYDMRMRTHDDELADTSFSLEHDSNGVRGTWHTALPVRDESFELIGHDGWVAPLPVTTPARRSDDQLALEMVPRLRYYSTRHSNGYATDLAAPPRAGEHLITISTPRSNVVAAEQRGDRGRLFIGIAMLVPGTIYAGVSAAFLSDAKHVSDKVIGGLFASAAVSLDVTAIYELVRGTRRKTLHP